MAVYKKAIPLLLAFMLVFAFAACGGEYNLTVNDSSPAENKTSSSAPDKTDSEEHSNLENTNQYGGNWPDNEFTRQVPKPEFKVHSVTVNLISCNITFSGTTTEQLKKYAEAAEDMGFTAVLTRETEIGGLTHYLYTARNENGYEIVITQSVSYSILSITKI